MMQNNLLCRQAIWLTTGRSDPIHLGLPGSSLIARDVIWGDSEFVLQGGCKAYVWLANGLYPWVWQWAPRSCRVVSSYSRATEWICVQVLLRLRWTTTRWRGCLPTLVEIDASVMSRFCHWRAKIRHFKNSVANLWRILIRQKWSIELELSWQNDRNITRTFFFSTK